MRIQINIQRPVLTLVVVAITVAWFTGWIRIDVGASNDGIGGMLAGPEIVRAQQDVDRERIRQAVLDHQEEIIRYDIELLAEEALRTHEPEAMRRLEERRQIFLGLMRDRKRSEQMLLDALERIWEGEGTAYSDHAPASNFRFRWPVYPKYGLSAHFKDESYKKLFHRDHHAVDVPTEAGTVVLAAAGGVVSKVSMNGYGYSFVAVKHAEGFETHYGHVSQSLVREGDRVSVGQEIAISNGAIGGLGTGYDSTGPHLHWSVKKDGVLVDPEKYVEQPIK